MNFIFYYSPFLLVILFLVHFVARPGLTKQQNECLYFDSEVHIGFCYQYIIRKKRDGSPRVNADGHVAYVCAGCTTKREKLRKRRNNGDGDLGEINQIYYNEDEERFTSNPDEQNHFCDPIPQSKATGTQIFRKVFKDIRGTNVSGGECLSKINKVVATLDPQTRREVLEAMPDNASLITMGRRHGFPINPLTCEIDDYFLLCYFFLFLI
uniref:Uncharacterized protein n=1 Tax=Panagrolaimus sp. PS1159 TaxID=55785 RepID=A0AC35GSD7_9BILA